MNLDDTARLWICQQCEDDGEDFECHPDTPCTATCHWSSGSVRQALDHYDWHCHECEQSVREREDDNPQRKVQVAAEYQDGTGLQVWCSLACRQETLHWQRHVARRRAKLRRFVELAWGPRARIRYESHCCPGWHDKAKVSAGRRGAYDALARVELADANLCVELWLGDLRAVQITSIHRPDWPASPVYDRVLVEKRIRAVQRQTKLHWRIYARRGFVLARRARDSACRKRGV